MKLMTSVTYATALLCAVGALAAEAAQIRVKCEVRGDRSVVSVDGRNLVAGMYSATISSGANTATARVLPTIGDEIEFDFASNANDVAQGASAIPVNFIQGATVTGRIKTPDGFVVVTDAVNCRAR